LKINKTTVVHRTILNEYLMKIVGSESEKTRVETQQITYTPSLVNTNLFSKGL
jgi:hypothetical protein